MAQYLSCTAGTDRATTPDDASLDFTDDIDIRAELSRDWTPAASTEFFKKTDSYFFILRTDGRLRFVGGNTDVDSTVATGFTDNTPHQLRVTRNRSTGDIMFFTRNPGTALDVDTGWTQLGTTINAVTDAIATSANVLEVTGGATSKLYEAWVSGTIDGAAAAWFDGDIFIVGDNAADTAVDTTGKTWTIAGATAIIEADGVTGTGASTLAGVTSAGAGAFIAALTGTGASTLAGVVSAGSGTFTGIAPPSSGGSRMGGNAIRKPPRLSVRRRRR